MDLLCQPCQPSPCFIEMFGKSSGSFDVCLKLQRPWCVYRKYCSKISAKIAVGSQNLLQFLIFFWVALVHWAITPSFLPRYRLLISFGPWPMAMQGILISLCLMHLELKFRERILAIVFNHSISSRMPYFSNSLPRVVNPANDIAISIPEFIVFVFNQVFITYFLDGLSYLQTAALPSSNGCLQPSKISPWPHPCLQYLICRTQLYRSAKGVRALYHRSPRCAFTQTSLPLCLLLSS